MKSLRRSFALVEGHTGVAKVELSHLKSARRAAEVDLPLDCLSNVAMKSAPQSRDRVRSVARRRRQGIII